MQQAHLNQQNCTGIGGPEEAWILDRVRAEFEALRIGLGGLE